MYLFFKNIFFDDLDMLVLKNYHSTFLNKKYIHHSTKHKHVTRYSKRLILLKTNTNKTCTNQSEENYSGFRANTTTRKGKCLSQSTLFY